MNIGGWHVFAGLFFLVCCMVLTIGYAYAFYLFFVVIKKLLGDCKKVFKRFKSFMSENSEVASLVTGESPQVDLVESPPLIFINKRFLKKASYVVVLLLMVVYMLQRFQWLGDDNTHYKAKEYYVAGQVVFAHRKIMELFVHPENILVRPYTALQKIIYTCGTRYLPSDDGERYVWKRTWFLYLYTRKMIRAYGVDAHAYETYEPDMVKLLDQFWEVIEGIATHEIRDAEMKKEYALSFSSLASFYELFRGYYTGKFRGSSMLCRKTPFLIERDQKLLQWLDQLGEYWNDSGLIKEIKSKHINVAVLRQGTTINILQDLALILVSKGGFSCDHPLIERLYNEYLAAMSDDPEKNYFLKYSKISRRKASVAFQSSVYSPAGGAANYLLSYICHKEMPVEKYKVVSRLDTYCEFYGVNRVEFVFREELKPLQKPKKNN